jgi:hypothetical protein
MTVSTARFPRDRLHGWAAELTATATALARDLARP